MPDINSGALTNYAATPRVRSDTLHNGIVKSAYGALVAPVTTTIIGDRLNFAFVPTNAAPRSLKVWALSAHTGGAIDIGLYYTDDNGGTAVDVDLFASALVTASGLTGAEQLFEATTLSLYTSLATPLWSLAGLSADPGGMFVLAATCTSAVATDAMTIAVDFQYVSTN